MNELVQELIEFLKNASPVVWQALVKQVYVNSMQCFVWAVFLVVVSIALYKFGKYCRKKHIESDNYWEASYEMGYIFSFIFSGLSVLGWFGLFVTAISYLINPEYYAIQLIISQLGH